MQAQNIAEEILRLSHEMLALAKSQSWDALIATEQRRATLLPEMDSRKSRIGSPADQLALIQAIQDCDNQILSYVEPWLKDTRTLLQRLGGNSGSP